MRKREAPSPFGMSFLDVLCCGLGAVTLLFVLTEISTREITEARQVKLATAKANVTATKNSLNTSQLEQAAIRLEPGEQQNSSYSIPSSFRPQLAPQVDMRRVVIVLDTSGSMARYYPDDSEYAYLPPELRTPGPKWRHAVRVVVEMLLAAEHLEGFVILRLSESREKECGQPLVQPDVGRWFKSDPLSVSILEAKRKLLEIQPSGGSEHQTALLEAVKYANPQERGLLEGGNPADTIVLITDGLPNHGPVEPNLSGTPRNPTSGVIEPKYKISRADIALQRVSGFISQTLPPNTHPKIHVVAMPWPDDIELPVFALKLASLGGGLALFPGIPEDLK